MHLGSTARLALRRTWLFSNLTVPEIAELYGIHKSTVKRLVKGLTRPSNPVSEADHGQLRDSFIRETRCASETSWLAAFLMAGELELIRLRQRMESAR